VIRRGDFVRGAGLLAAGSLCGSPLRAEAVPTIYNDPRFAAELRVANPAPPPVPFDSNHNYIMYGGGKPILGLVVTIEPTEDLVALGGMSMQLNCYSPARASCVYQQYVTGLDKLSKSKTLHLGSSIENFPSDTYRAQLHRSIGLHATGDLYNQHFHFAKFAAPGARVPAGWKVKWELFNDANDPTGTITGARYSVISDKGEVQTSGRQMIRRFTFSNTSVPVTAEAMAPILAFEMNMVGGNNGKFAHVAGAGTITYEGSALTPLGTLPAGLATGAHTAERSNIRYAELPASSTTKTVQKFRAIHQSR
jgi:hypothetical protein